MSEEKKESKVFNSCVSEVVVNVVLMQRQLDTVIEGIDLIQLNEFYSSFFT